MRLLHVGSGFRPWRRGGLVAYVEDLMDEQVRAGHDVAYFFSGRQYPRARGPRLKRWERRGVAMLEVVNSPIYDHGRQPALELSEPETERMLATVLERVRPDVVHVQELAGLPTSALEVIRAAGVPVVVTLQDYFPLCATFKLLDADGRVCLRREVGADCIATIAAEPQRAGLMMEATVRYHLERAPLFGRLPPGFRERQVQRAAGAVARREVARRRRAAPPEPLEPGIFQRRRELNVERLNGADRLIAMSHRVAEIYAQLGADERRLRTIHLTLAHIARLTPRRRGPAKPVTFGTLAGLESPAKGGHVLLGAMRSITEHAEAGRARLLVFGHVDGRFAADAERLPGVELRGTYRPGEQDALLDEVDVGIVPSVWEEAYGYAGVEFLAKGIPVVANAIGGMPDYTRDGETGWLNYSCSADELARIMDGIVRRPERAAELNEKVLAARDSIVKPMSRHAAEMDAVYDELVTARRA